ncbi:MAG: efflux RND transporter periplasmic adaptor subunit, partial [Chloroflexota bacterium]
MTGKKIWIIAVIFLALAGAAFFFRDSLTGLAGGENQAQAQESQGTVAIRSAADIVQVSATGNIQLVEQQAAVFEGAGIIAEVFVKEGDEVKVGDPLLKLETDALERAVQQAQLALEVSQNQRDQLLEPATEADLDQAYANLASAQESLAELQAGPTETELAATQAGLAAAQAGYQDLLAGLSEAELTQLSADLHKAYLTLQQAQEAYNEIAYRGDIGRTQQATDLQTATIDYDTAKAAYDIATEGASESDVQNALKAIKDAQVQVEALIPTKADLLAAEAQVSSAQASLTGLLNGPTETEVRDADLSMEQARLNVEQAQADLDKAELRATIAGIVLSVDVEVGQKTTSDLSSALIIGDLTNLELPVYVAEVDINKVKLGQAVNIAVDALPDQVFNGEVSRIAPISESASGVVNYEVTIRLKDLEIADGVRPGMTAVATILSDKAANAWLVPTSALVEFEGQHYVRLMRNGQASRIEVTPGVTQGEWTVVQSEELQAGDQVVGQVTSHLDDSENLRGPRMFVGGGGPPPR